MVLRGCSAADNLQNKKNIMRTEGRLRDHVTSSFVIHDPWKILEQESDVLLYCPDSVALCWATAHPGNNKLFGILIRHGALVRHCRRNRALFVVA
jgi:hypothetical protein